MAEIEIELKLRIDPAAVERFRRDPAIHRAKRARARSIALRAVYFDTPGLDLRQMKSALRIRQEGIRRIQTLKMHATNPATGTVQGGSGLQRRLEFNAETDLMVPDLSLIQDQAVQAQVQAIIARDGLEEIFATDVRRTAWLLDLPDGVVELALDIGTINSAGTSVDICEVELELKHGDAKTVLDFADILIERYGCTVAEETKASRGYALYQQLPSRPRRAIKPELNPKHDAWTSLTSIVEAGAAQLIGNDATVLAGVDIEGVHQARVAVRRLRAALSAFRSIIPDDLYARLNKSLRRHIRILGAARDLDVFLDETLGPLLAQKNAPKALRQFAKRCETARALSYKRVHKEMRSARYGRLQLELIRFSTHDVPDIALGVGTETLAANLLDAQCAAVVDAAGRSPGDLPEADQHALRITIKNLRYTIDCFAKIYPKPKVKEWRSATKKLQQCLGGLNDAVVHNALLDRMDAPDMPVKKSVRRAIQAANEKKVAHGLNDLAVCWETFSALTPFWENGDTPTEPESR